MAGFIDKSGLLVHWKGRFSPSLPAKIPPREKGWRTSGKHGAGWKAEIERRGVRTNKTFETKAAAVAWAGQKEAEIMAGHRGEIPNLTVSERYSSATRGLRAQEGEALGADTPEGSRTRSTGLGKLRQLDTPHVSAWQERRLKAVSSASVRRERNLLNNVFEIARKEWKWLAKNPFVVRQLLEPGSNRQSCRSGLALPTLPLILRVPDEQGEPSPVFQLFSTHAPILP
jgi:hypothetical protein